ncbi:hypothetical protein DFJ63DRAFT_332587 [Scheffersomyces coipomensis]|uniref:uncharacterized protein n=1 Tax=Scheffersomyces coipomensis TaxID=1788519 RepID=UPI00315D61E2
MSTIESILIHPIALLNISANTSLDSGSRFGVLLGRYSSSKVVIYTSFEILFFKPHQIDVEYNLKRYTQFKVVLPEYSFIGIYHIKGDSLSIDDSTTSVLTQLAELLLGDNQLEVPLVSITYDSHALNNGKSFQGYLGINPIKTGIISSESEFIATSTVAKFKDYRSVIQKGSNDDDEDSNLVGNYVAVNDGLISTVDHLQDRIARIINFVASARNQSLSQDEKLKLIDINNSVVYLSNKLNSFKQNKSINNNTLEGLQVSQLSLITEQIVALDHLKTQINKTIIRYALNS